ncbi:hypothetical protein FN846DRAFT_891984 [Sphaerosporella brunnea]|uniref:Uncharacterized protein n=1 Tax=Sphaerosporella brunnea TaxID=1250544 RepID=A0A5J5ERV4_9PEZI|nr:hypothetical protein FN846DRAFT_891984 [Sphaerosporella brunnea]
MSSTSPTTSPLALLPLPTDVPDFRASLLQSLAIHHDALLSRGLDFPGPQASSTPQAQASAAVFGGCGRSGQSVAVSLPASALASYEHHGDGTVDPILRVWLAQGAGVEGVVAYSRGGGGL